MNRHPSLSLSNNPTWGAIQIAVAYLLVGGLWILFSDQVAARIALDQQMLTIISLYKGWGYVLVTAFLLYLLIRRHTSTLRASEGQLRRVIDAMPIFISYVGSDKRYRFSNQTYKEWHDDQVEGKHMEELIGKAAYQTVSKYIDRALAGEVTSYETEVPYQDKELFMTATYIPDLGADGQVKGFFVMAQDRTAQRQAEEEHRLWADAFEGCYHGIAIGDPHTNRIVVCNPAFANLHKSRVEDIVGSAILSLYAPADQEHVRRNIERADQIGHARFEAHMVRKDGPAFPVQMDIVSVLGEDGELLYRVATAQDISERKRAEEVLQESEERYRVVSELTSDYAYKDRVETDGSIVPEWITDSFTRITGYSFEETQSPDFWQRMVHPDYLQILFEHTQTILTGQPDTQEFRIITKSGQVRWLRDYANPVWDAQQQRVASLYGAVQDVTERKHSEEESKSLARFPEENPSPVLRATYEGNIVYANAASSPLLKDWGTKTGDYLPADWVTLIEELIKTRSPKTIEMQCGETLYSFMLGYVPNANDVNIYGRDITEGKQAKEYLRRFELLSKHSRDMILFIGRKDGQILEVNAAAVSAYGYSREELLSRTIQDLRASDTLNLTAEQMAQADTAGILFETVHRRKDGSTFPVEVSSQGATIGGVRTLISIIRDITERKRAEEALRLKDQLLHLTSEMAKVGGWEFDPETGKGTWTDEVARIHDLDPAQETNVELGLGFYVAESRAKIERAVKEAIELGKPYDLELEMVSAKGQHKWIRTMALPIVQNDKVVKVQGIFQDITERKKIEKALQTAHAELELKVQERTSELSEANALLTALMNNVPDHIYFKDLQSCFIRTSRSQANLLGLNDPAEVIGKTDFDFFPHAARAYAEEQEVMKSGKPLLDLEEWVVWPDGRETWVSTTKMPLRNSEGQTIGIFGISHDITERKRTEREIKQLNSDLENQAEKLKAANKELEAFSYSVSHDLRAPLRAIDGYTRILVEDYESILDAEGKRVCSIISREARRMGELIDDLLAFSRLGRKEIYTSKIDMRRMAVSVLNELLKEEERARLDFHIGKLPPARGDSALMRQVWFNLLANAIKFTSRKERAVIEIGSKTSKDELLYYVRDSGAGFEMEYANKLFGVFQRLHSESEFDGTGVGLAIVQRIINRHEGRVWAEGEVGKGATFYFALPRKEDPHE